MARDRVRATAEFEPVGKGSRASVDRPVGGNPQDLALGTLGRGAKRGQIRELPGNQSGIRSEPSMELARQPLRAGGAERTVPVEDEPGDLASHRCHDFNLPPTGASSRLSHRSWDFPLSAPRVRTGT